MKDGKKNIIKTNLILFLGLCVSFVATYLFIEKKQLRENAQREKENTLLPQKEKIGELQKIQGDHLEILKKGETFYFKDNNIPVDQQKLDKYFYYLTKLKIKEEIRLEEITLPLTLFVPEKPPSLEFQFEKKRLLFLIGNKINYSQDFYLQVNEIDLANDKDIKRRLFIVKDDAPLEGMYSEEGNEKSDNKYLRTKGLFLLPSNYFYDLHILPSRLQNKLATLKTIELKSYRSPKFLIDFKNQKTAPPPIGKSSYITSVFVDYSKELKNARGEDLIESFDKEKLKDKLAEMIIVDSDGETILTLWNKYENFSGPFVNRDKDHFLIKMKKDATLVFTLPLQSFWDKSLGHNPMRITLKKNEQSKEIVDFLIENNKDHIKRTLLRYKDQNLEITSPHEIKSVALENLLDLVSKDADYISVVDLDDNKNDFKKLAEVLVDGKKYYLKSQELEWEAISLEDKVKWHYSKGTHPNLTLNLEEYLK